MNYFKCFSAVLLLLVVSCESPDLFSQYTRYEISDSGLSKKVYIITEHRGLSYEQTYIAFDSNYCNIDSVNSIWINGALQEFTYTAQNDTLFVYTRKLVKKHALSAPPFIVFVEDKNEKVNDFKTSRKVRLRKNNNELLRCPVAE